METAISCRKCSHVAGLINKVCMQKHLKGSVAMCVLLACMSYIAHQYHDHYPGGTTSLDVVCLLLVSDWYSNMYRGHSTSVYL